MELRIMTEKELVLSVKDGIRPCYLLYGRDTASVEGFAKKLTAKLVPPEARDLNYHFFPAEDLNLDALSDCIEALPVFAERVVAAINDLDCDKLSQKDIKRLQEIISSIDSETTTMIIYCTAVDLCGGRKKLTAANKTLVEHILKQGGAVCEFKIKSAAELTRYIIKNVEKSGSHISEQAARRLSEACMGDLLMIGNEISKLSAYRFGGEITEEDIKELVAGRIDADAYRLARLISEGKREEAFLSLAELYDLQSQTLGILAAISSSFIDLYRAKLALISGRGEKDITGAFQYRGREFAAKYAMKDCARIPIDRLRRCISILSECEAKIKSLRTDDRILLEEAVARMFTET